MTIDRKAARARCDGATEGPWTYIPNGPLGGEVRECEDFTTICIMHDYDDRPEDFAFIAAARTDLPAALDELDAKDAEIERLRGIIERLAMNPDNAFALRAEAMRLDKAALRGEGQ